jgi:hypothetical protein
MATGAEARRRPSLPSGCRASPAVPRSPMNAFANLSPLDRLLRVLSAIAVLVVGVWIAEDAMWRACLQAFGWIPLLTGVLGWDPLYALLGWNTRRKRVRSGSRPPAP